MTKLSILDLSPIKQGSDARGALMQSLDLAQHAEQWGYQRYWVAEHHNMQGIASAATSVVLAHLAAGTNSIRLGAGGIMLPNHSPLVIAEQFGTLAALHPGRIDLGLGRAPGTDQITAQALRRTLQGDVDEFPKDVRELQQYFKPVQPGQRIQAVPGSGLDVPIWILGSSLYGAQLAAAFGLPYAFASHFAPAALEQAVAIYRDTFRPSEYLAKPYVMLGFNAVVADTDEEAHLLRTSSLQSFVNLRKGVPGKLPPPKANFAESLSAGDQQLLAQIGSCSAVGNSETVKAEMQAFIKRTGADELMVVTSVFEHEARLKSYELLSGLQEAG